MVDQFTVISLTVQINFGVDHTRRNRKNKRYTARKALRKLKNYETLIRNRFEADWKFQRNDYRRQRGLDPSAAQTLGTIRQEANPVARSDGQGRKLPGYTGRD